MLKPSDQTVDDQKIRAPVTFQQCLRPHMMRFALELTVLEIHLDKPAIDLHKRSPVGGAVGDGGAAAGS